MSVYVEIASDFWHSQFHAIHVLGENDLASYNYRIERHTHIYIYIYICMYIGTVYKAAQFFFENHCLFSICLALFFTYMYVLYRSEIQHQYLTSTTLYRVYIYRSP